MCVFKNIFKYVYQLSGYKFCLVWDQMAMCKLSQDIIIIKAEKQEENVFGKRIQGKFIERLNGKRIEDKFQIGEQ